MSLGEYVVSFLFRNGCMTSKMEKSLKVLHSGDVWLSQLGVLYFAEPLRHAHLWIKQAGKAVYLISKATFTSTSIVCRQHNCTFHWRLHVDPFIHYLILTFGWVNNATGPGGKPRDLSRQTHVAPLLCFQAREDTVHYPSREFWSFPRVASQLDYGKQL